LGETIMWHVIAFDVTKRNLYIQKGVRV